MKHEWVAFRPVGIPGIVGIECACRLVSLIADDGTPPQNFARCPNDRDEPEPEPGEAEPVPLSEQPIGTRIEIRPPEQHTQPSTLRPAAATSTDAAGKVAVVAQSEATAATGEYQAPTDGRLVTDGKTGQVLHFGILKERPAPDPALFRKMSPEWMAAKGLASIDHVVK